MYIELIASITKIPLFKYIEILPPKTIKFSDEKTLFFIFLLKKIDCGYSIESPRLSVKNIDCVYPFFIFLLKKIDCGYSLESPRLSVKNIDCGYPFEPLWRGGSNEYPQSIFLAEIIKIMYTR